MSEPAERAGMVTTAVVALGCLAYWVAIDRWELRPDPQFFAQGIPVLAWYGLGILVLTAILRFAAGATLGFAPLLTVTMGLVPPLLLLFTLAVEYLDSTRFFAACALVGLYVLLYLARALRALSGKAQRNAAVAGLLFIAVFVWITDELNVIPDVWSARDTPATSATDAAGDSEAILFGQAALIDRKLADITADRGAKPRAFFVGFAGVGAQKVFAQEIELAAGVLGDKYAIDGRTLSLVNDERDLRAGPLATVSGLTYALQGLAARMNLDRDVLFLAISSHGSDDRVIAVSNAQLPLNDLTEEDLANALRKSAIKWRVIIISACYAGAFIDSLRDPQTIVITAAAADRTSFGCSNDSDLTYFGSAFYRDALPSARTLREAFDKAKVAVSARERSEHVTASNPQAFFGKQIEDRLERLGSK